MASPIPRRSQPALHSGRSPRRGWPPWPIREDHISNRSYYRQIGVDQSVGGRVGKCGPRAGAAWRRSHIPTPRDCVRSSLWLNVYGSVTTSRRLSPANPARGLRVRTRRCITHEPPRRPSHRPGGPFDYFDAKAGGPTKLQAEANPKTPTHGEGDFVSTRHPSKPSEEGKRRKSAFAENSSAAVAPPRSSGTPTPDEKARRLAVLRALLADAAPAFQARIDAGDRGEQP